MGFLVVIPFGALAAFVIFRIHRWLRRGEFGPEWWKAFRLLASAGLALGLWFALFTRYNVGNVHLEGFPIPLKIASRDTSSGPWVYAAIPELVRAGAAVTDLLYGGVVCLAPLSLAAFIKENRGTKDFSGAPRP
jgi:amino acid transporter